MRKLVIRLPATLRTALANTAKVRGKSMTQLVVELIEAEIAPYAKSVRNVFTAIRDTGTEADFKPLPASRPTTARQGSPEKLRVMIDRVERGEELFHPDDGPLDSSE